MHTKRTTIILIMITALIVGVGLTIATSNFNEPVNIKGPLNMFGYNITNASSPLNNIVPNCSTSYAYTGTSGQSMVCTAFLLLSGGTMSGDIDMGGNDITNINSTNTDYLESDSGTINVLDDVDFNGNKIVNTDYSNISTLNMSKIIFYNDFEDIGNDDKLYDVSGNGYNFTMNLSRTGLGIDNCTYNCSGLVTDGKYGQGLFMDGIQDYYVGPRLNTSTYMTVSVWVKTGYDSGYGRVLSRNWANDKSFVLMKDNGVNSAWRFGLVLDGDQRLTTSTTIPNQNLDEWMMITGTYDGNNIKIYVNGIFEDNVVYVDEEKWLNAVYTIGVLNNDAFNGTIDELYVFERALTQDEINILYRNGVNKQYNDIRQGGTISGKITYKNTIFRNLNVCECGQYSNGTIIGCTFWNETGHWTTTGSEVPAICN